MRNLLRFVLAVLPLTLPLFCQARPLHIIHTNDLHSYFNGYEDGRGGYARLLTKIKELRSESESKGIKILQVDAGDWGEGTSFFVSEKGATSIKALEKLGTEVAVIGNHDHMLGGKVLGQQIRKANAKTRFVSANIVQTPDMELGDLLAHYVDLERAEIPIRVIGLSTSALHFQYQISPGKILNPVPVGVEHSKRARAAGKKLVIALGHIGMKEDEKLAKKSKDIDLIIGGHSHTKLDKIFWAKNKKSKKIPIVQAWAHGLAVGSLLIEVRDEGGIEVLDYKLHEIKEELPEDPDMKGLVAKAEDERDDYFNGKWDEVIGETKVPMTGQREGRSVLMASCWGQHMARMSREAGNADVGVHLAAFEGVFAPAGEITFGKMVDQFPHFRKYGDMGWEIATIKVTGVVLRPILTGIYLLRNKLGVNFDGLTYKKSGSDIEFEVEGKSINDKAIYLVAFPAEIGLALKATLPWMSARHIPGLVNTGKYYWPSMEQYILKNSPIDCQ